MADPVVIGVDVGTTAAKASTFWTRSRRRLTAVREYPLLAPHPGWAEQDPHLVAEALILSLADAVRPVGGDPVVAVALSAAMHGLIGLSADGRPLTPIVTWADGRAADEAAALRADGTAGELHRRSGTPVHPMSPLTKLLWFRHHDPTLFARVRHWIGLKDWLLLTLTGQLATELSTASGSGLLDLGTRTWDPRTTALVGIAPDQLPPVLSTTSTLPLAHDAARRSGLPVGTPVVLGAGDGPLGNVGTGALDPGTISLSVGTSAAVRAVVPAPVTDDEALFCYAVTDDAWVVGGAVSNAGSVQRWAATVFGAGRDDRADLDDASLLDLAAAVPAGCEGLLALPYLLPERAPLWDPAVAGAFLGVRAHHTRGHFVRAGLEGVALQIRAVLDRLDAQLQHTGPVTALRATGGVFRSPLWHRILADVLDRPVTVTAAAEGSALGAAALGLVATGRAPSPAAAVAALRPPAHADDPADLVVTPDPATAALHRGQTPHLHRLLEDCRRVAASR